MIIRLALVLFTLLLLPFDDLQASCSPGGEGEPPCRTVAALDKGAASTGCGSGTFDGLNGYCYSCPTHYEHQSLRTYNDPKVCKRTYGWEYKHAESISCLKSGGWGVTDCYKCPTGYSHDNTKASTSGEACRKKPDPSYHSATEHNPVACDAGETHANGRCYQCPSNSSRNMNAITSPAACTVATADICAKGLHNYGGTCASSCYAAHNCGGNGQKACGVTSCLPSCDKGHYEDFDGGSVCKTTPATSTPFAMSMDAMGSALDGLTDLCSAGAESTLNTLQKIAGISPNKNAFGNKNLFALEGCPSQFDIGYYCAAPSYVGGYFHGLAAATNSSQAVLVALQKFDAAKPCNTMVPPINGLCAGIMATNEQATGAMQCINKVWNLVIDEYQNPAMFNSTGKTSNGDYSSEISAVCKLGGSLTFGFTADAAITSASAGALASVEAEKAVVATIKGAMAIHTILRKANTARNVAAAGSKAVANTDDATKDRIKNYIKTTAACAPLLSATSL